MRCVRIAGLLIAGSLACGGDDPPPAPPGPEGPQEIIEGSACGYLTSSCPSLYECVRLGPSYSAPPPVCLERCASDYACPRARPRCLYSQQGNFCGTQVCSQDPAKLCRAGERCVEGRCERTS